MQNANVFEDRLSVNQVAKYLKVHLATVYRWTSIGVRGKRLPSFLVGGRRYVALADLEQFLRPAAPTARDGDSTRATQARERLRSYGIKSPKGKNGAT